MLETDSVFGLARTGDCHWALLGFPEVQQRRLTCRAVYHNLIVEEIRNILIDLTQTAQDIRASHKSNPQRKFPPSNIYLGRFPGFLATISLASVGACPERVGIGTLFRGANFCGCLADPGIFLAFRLLGSERVLTLSRRHLAIQSTRETPTFIGKPGSELNEKRLNAASSALCRPSSSSSFPRFY